ncbi:MAG: hypothetical protein RSP_20780 [Rhodanobacter sp.]
MRRIGSWLCAMAACTALAACGLPSDGRVRPAASLPDGPVGAAASPPEFCPDGSSRQSNPFCLTPAQQRKQEQQQTVNEINRIRTGSGGQ